MNCPTCSSPDPRQHPATQSEGEVTHLCNDPFHTTTLAHLTDYDVHVRLTAGTQRRLIGIRLPATSADAARYAAALVGDAVNEATNHTYKIATTRSGDLDVSANPCRSSIYPEHEDRWSEEIAPYTHLAIDQGGCFVLRVAGTSVTLTDLAKVVNAMVTARQVRDAMEQQESSR